MKCGTHANSDRTLRSIRIVLADGTVLDTADQESRAAFARTHAALLAGIELIKAELAADTEASRVDKVQILHKDVTGLNLLPFVLFDDPFDTIAHCMVGSEAHWPSSPR